MDGSNIDMLSIQKTMSLYNFSKNEANKDDFYNCEVHDIEDICSIINNIEAEVVKKQSGFFGKIFVNLEKICEDYLLKLKNSIYDHLIKNKDKYYINEPYYGYSIYLKHDEE